MGVACPLPGMRERGAARGVELTILYTVEAHDENRKCKQLSPRHHGACALEEEEEDAARIPSNCSARSTMWMVDASIVAM